MNNIWNNYLQYWDIFRNDSDTNYMKFIDYHKKELANKPRILETGAGTGNLTIELLKDGHYVDAVDLSTYATGILMKKCKDYEENLNTLNMDVKQLGFESCSFDGASSMFLIPFVKDISEYFREIHRVLKNGGIYTFSAWIPREDDYRNSIIEYEKSLVKRDLLPKYQQEWNCVKEYNIELCDIISKQGLTPEQLTEQLTDAGFKEIKPFSENPYLEAAFSCTCKK